MKPLLPSFKVPLPFNKDHYERLAWAQNKGICGVDEVGRGCLAGPVVTAAVLLPPGIQTELFKDSKILSPAQREHAFSYISKNAVYSYAIMSNQEIDRYNIWQATLKCMRRAIIQLFNCHSRLPEHIVVDAMPVSLVGSVYQSIPLYYFIKGEQHSSAIAAASIIAKVIRDRMMVRMEHTLPGYKFGQHKGYSTQVHKASLDLFGHSFIHRISFIDHLPQFQNISSLQIAD